ncbi:MAG: ABC transporter permease, partial [Polyangiales bacterium]
MSLGRVSMLTSMLALFRKEVTQALRDPQMLFVLLVVPVVQLMVLGYAANLEFDRADTVVVDDDRSDKSRAFVEGLAADRTFVVTRVDSVVQATDALRRNDAIVAVIIPRNYGRDVLARVPARVQVLVDGSDPTRSVAASAALEQYAAVVSMRESVARMPPGAGLAVPRVSIEPRLLYNPSLKSRIFVVPATGASILVIVAAIVTAMGLSREREVGTMEQLLVTPIRPLALMLGKTLPYAMFGLIDQALILVVGTLARTQQQALMGSFFIIIPATLISGMMSPIEAMPAWVQPLAWVNPV